MAASSDFDIPDFERFFGANLAVRALIGERQCHQFRRRVKLQLPILQSRALACDSPFNPRRLGLGLPAQSVAEARFQLQDAAKKIARFGLVAVERDAMRAARLVDVQMSYSGRGNPQPVEP